MHYTSFLLIKNFFNLTYAQEAPSNEASTKPAVTPQGEQIKKNIEKLKNDAKKFEKKYRGAEGAKKLQKDIENNIHSEAKSIRDYNESAGNQNVLQLMKGYDRMVVKEVVQGKEVTRFKTLDEIKKETEKVKGILLKAHKKEVDEKEVPLSGTSQKEGIGELSVKQSGDNKKLEFNYQAAVIEEQRLRSENALKQAQKDSHDSHLKTTAMSGTYYIIIPIVAIIAGLFLWKKYFNS